MKKMLSIAAIGCASLVFSSDSQAREFADIYTDCGLGAMIAPNNEAVAAVTNVTWDLGTTAISSNASSEDTCQGGQAKSAALIYKSYPELERDIANGEGEHLNALLTMVNVDSDAHNAVIEKLRPAFASLVNADNYDALSREDKAAALYDLLQVSI